MTTYNFRDPEDMLKNIDKGKRSSFIRDAVKSKIRLDRLGYDKKLEVNQQLIEYYTYNINNIDIQIDILENEKKELEKLKKSIKDKRNHRIDECNRIKENKNEESKDEEGIEHECLEKTMEIMFMIRYDDNIDIDFNYMKSLGGFKSMLYFKKRLRKFADENIRINEYINGKKIKQDDIEYIKEKIEEIR